MRDDWVLSSQLPGAPVRRRIRPRNQEAAALFRRTPRLLPCIALGLALFLAQVAAILHSTGHAGPDRQPGLHSQLCDACLSFSTIFSMSGGPGTLPLLPPAIAAFLVVFSLVSLIERRAPRVFRSRAPPLR